ncbi:MAG: heme exporter protein CcmB [Hyphomicrobiales bacterium]
MADFLIALLVVPLYVPVLNDLRRNAACTPYVTGSLWQPLFVVCALSLASIVLAPLAAAAALRNAMR